MLAAGSAVGWEVSGERRGVAGEEDGQVHVEEAIPEGVQLHVQRGEDHHCELRRGEGKEEEEEGGRGQL